MIFGGRLFGRLVLAAVVALSLSACGGDDGSGGAPMPTPTPTPTPVPTPTPTPTPDALPPIGTPDQVVQAMAPGINFGNTLESLDTWETAPFTVSKETVWGNPAANQTIFNAYAVAGFKSVRIPVAWSQYTDAQGNIAPFWLARVKQVVDYARNAGLYVVINIHNDPWVIPDNAHQADANAKLKSYWTQIATYFAGYDNHLLFAATNEVHMPDVYSAPTAENCTVQSGFNQAFVDAVRATGGNNASRTLVVQHYATNIDWGLDICKEATLPTDSVANRLMVEIHYYTPFDFVDSSSQWANIWQWGALATDRSAVDSCCNEAYVRQELDRMKTAYIDKGVPVIMGEYGAATKSSGSGKGIKTYVNYWDGYVTYAAIKHGVVPMYWDIGELIDRNTGATKDTGVLTAIISGVTTDPEPQTAVGVNGG
jgi:endoglucanase